MIPRRVETTTSERQYNQKRPRCQADRPQSPTLAKIGGGKISVGKIGVGVAVATAGFALATLVYAYAATHPPRRRFIGTPTAVGLEFEEIVFPARDGLKISGWYLPAPFPADKQGVIVCCHGYPQNRLEMLPYAQFLHDAGFAALVFDFRALGRSEGSLCSFGHQETADLQGALDYLDTRSDTATLPKGVLGLSLGAAVAILASAQDERVQAVVAEAPYPNLRDALNRRCSLVFGPLGKSVAAPILWWARRWISLDPSTISPAAVMHLLAPRPLLLIQGQRDMLVDWRDTARMAQVAPDSTDLWLLPQAGHARCFRLGGEEYRRRVTRFFQQNLDRG